MLFKNNLLAWEALYLTSKTGNVSRTAVVMGMDVSKVSRLITGLAAELGYEVLDKSHRPFSATVQGGQLLRMLEPLVTGFREVRDYAEGMAKLSLIRVAAPPELVQDFYAAQFVRYSLQRPGVQFAVRPEANEADVRAGRVDCAIMNHHPNDAAGLIVRPLLVNSTPVLTTPDYVRRHGMPHSVEDLANHMGLLQESASQTPTQYLYNGGKASTVLHWKRVFVTHDQVTLKNLLLENMGITVDLFIGHVTKELEEGRIIPILPGWERNPWRLCLVTKEDKELESTEVRLFAEWWAATEAREAAARAVKARDAVERAFGRRYKKDVVTRYMRQYIKMPEAMKPAAEDHVR